MAFSMIAIDHAEARRGGSFGSRGTKTFQSAPPTRTAPQQTAPVDRSMTPNTNTNSAARQTPAGPQRPGFMNGFGGTMLKGLALGGLIGLLMGQGLGGLAGMFGLLLQVLLIGGLVMLALRFFRSRQQQQPALAGAGSPAGMARNGAPGEPGGNIGGFRVPSFGGGGAQAPAQAAPVSEDISLEEADLNTFERMLTEVQEAFGREDHAAMRRLTTPEIVSYLSEELAENAQNGVRNEVTDVKLLQADIAEAWSEGDREFATAALNYESRDVVRDRQTGAVVDGDADEPTETTELWTFVRPKGGEWQVSAIQQA
ncbi:Tim44 domain-containing protein [Arvimicrobium flavum]|uniref:Tim44 domain-containing protein n=1 Tax=Arvimicrobium flavum TaxID=3393320 RepID=UPI00237BEAE7|nr:Tim44 domain-containing protein [Mesorhizobium shangrilense]